VVLVEDPSLDTAPVVPRALLSRPGSPVAPDAPRLPWVAPAQPGASLSTELLGSGRAGLSVRPLTMVERDELGPSRLRHGHVLAADLRMRMGDNSVILEYARSLVESEFAVDADDQQGQDLQAGFLHELSDRLSVDLGYRRMSASFAPVASLLPADDGAPLHGVQAGLRWQGLRWGLAGRAAVYKPEGAPIGYMDQFGAQATYAPADSLQLSVLYQTTNRRRLANLEDAWRNYLNARVEYGMSRNLRADLSYKFDSGQQPTSGRQQPLEHAVGVSLGLSF
jgi:hypothetical protein